METYNLGVCVQVLAKLHEAALLHEADLIQEKEKEVTQEPVIPQMPRSIPTSSSPATGTPYRTEKLG